MSRFYNTNAHTMPTADEILADWEGLMPTVTVPFWNDPYGARNSLTVPSLKALWHLDRPCFQATLDVMRHTWDTNDLEEAWEHAGWISLEDAAASRYGTTH